MRRVDYKTIILSDLDRATFIHSDQYTPRITRHHEHVLTFTKESGDWLFVLCCFYFYLFFQVSFSAHVDAASSSLGCLIPALPG